MTETVTIAADGITLDLLLWRRWGEAGEARLEETLVLNPGLAALGPEIPAGTEVVLPSATTTTVTTTAVDLFG